MSFKAMKWALGQPVAKRGDIKKALEQGAEPPGLSSNERHVLISLADRLNEKTRKCHPGMRLLADDTGLAVSTVELAITALRDFGLIEIDPTAAPARRTRGSEKPVNGYKLHTDRRYGSVPSSGTGQHRPAVHNQEPNQEVPAPPARGTEPGTAQENESGTDEWKGRARPEGGLPKSTVPDSSPIPSGQCEPPTANGGSPSELTSLVACEHRFSEYDGWRYSAWRDEESNLRIVRTMGTDHQVHVSPMPDDVDLSAPLTWVDVRDEHDEADRWLPLASSLPNVRRLGRSA